MRINRIAFIALTGTVVFSCGTKKTADTAVIISTNETIDEAYMDKSVSPKEDFFLYANGTWCKENPVPDSESRWGSFNELDKANKTKLTTILENAAANNSVAGSQNQILGDYYSTFLDMKQRNKASYKPLTEELDIINSLANKEMLPSIIGKLHKNGVRALFNYGVRQDLKNIDQNIASLSQGGIGLPNRDYYEKEGKKEILDAYEAYIVKIFDLYGKYSLDTKTAKNQVMKIEKNLASKMMLPAELRIPEKTYNKMGLENIDAMSGDFNFESYIEEVGIQMMDSIIVGQPLFFENFKSLLTDISIEEWKTYLTWSVLNNYAGHLDDKFVQANFDFYSTVLKGQKEMKPISDRAIDEITITGHCVNIF